MYLAAQSSRRFFAPARWRRSIASERAGNSQEIEREESLVVVPSAGLASDRAQHFPMVDQPVGPLATPLEAARDPLGVFGKSRGVILDRHLPVVFPARLGAVGDADQVGDRQRRAALEPGRRDGHVANEHFFIRGSRGELLKEVAGAFFDEIGELVGKDDFGAEPTLEGIAPRLFFTFDGARSAGSCWGEDNGRCEGDAHAHVHGVTPQRGCRTRERPAARSARGTAARRGPPGETI